VKTFRIRRVLARSSAGQPEGARRQLLIDPDRATVSMGDRTIRVTAKEFHALSYLLSKGGAVCTKDELARHVWPEYEGAVDDYNVEQLMSRLRRKVEPDHTHPEYLLTVRGMGYRLEASGSTTSTVPDDAPTSNRGRSVPVIVGLAALAAVVAAAFVLLFVREALAPEPSAGAIRPDQWLLREHDEFSSPEQSLFPKGAGSTTVGLIFSRVVEDGEYVIRVLKAPEKSGLSATAQPVFLDTFAFEAATRNSGPIQNGLTLFWGAADFIQLRLQPAARSYELVQGPQGTLAKRDDSPLIEANGTNQLRFEVRRNQLSVFINGALAETLTLESIARRPVTPGLFLYVQKGAEVAEGSGVKVSFDNFRVLAAKD
jgi:DNA-binding winged helix-turn-helix (wHTH) protein